MSVDGWHMVLYVSVVLMLGAMVAQQLLLIGIRRDRSARGIGSWKDLFTDPQRIIQGDNHLMNRQKLLAKNRSLVIAGGAGALGAIIALFGLGTLRLKG